MVVVTDGERTKIKFADFVVNFLNVDKILGYNWSAARPVTSIASILTHSISKTITTMVSLGLFSKCLNMLFM